MTTNPEYEIAVADSVGLAMQVVLETLTPAERVALVLHDMLAVPFEDIAAVIGRSQDAARQLASRARRRVQGAKAKRGAGRAHRREIIDGFIAASRGGDFAALLTLFDSDVVLSADAEAVRLRPTVASTWAPTTACSSWSAAVPKLRAAGTLSGSRSASRPAFTGATSSHRSQPPGQPCTAGADRRPDWPDDLCEIVYVDSFGNAMTGLRAAILPPNARLAAAGQVFERAKTFSVGRGPLVSKFERACRNRRQSGARGPCRGRVRPVTLPLYEARAHRSTPTPRMLGICKGAPAVILAHPGHASCMLKDWSLEEHVQTIGQLALETYQTIEAQMATSPNFRQTTYSG